MKPARPRTRAVVKLLLQTDSEVDAQQMKLVMDILDGNPPPGVLDDSPIPHVVRRRQIMEVLGVCSRTVDNLAAKGLLTPVRGIGRWVLTPHCDGDDRHVVLSSSSRYRASKPDRTLVFDCEHLVFRCEDDISPLPQTSSTASESLIQQIRAKKDGE